MNVKRTRRIEVGGHAYEIWAVAVPSGTEVGIYRAGELIQGHPTFLVDSEVAADLHVYHQVDALDETMAGTESRFCENYTRYKQMGIVQ